MEDSELLGDQETLVALSELLLKAQIEFRGEESVHLTDKGVDHAWELFHSHTAAEKLELILLLARLREIAREETKDG